MKGGDLDGEVEWGDTANITEWPSVACGCLTIIVSRDIEGTVNEPWVISCEVLEELPCDCDLPRNLGSALGHHSLCKFGEIFMNLGLPHFLGDSEENVTIHGVSMDIFDWVVEPINRYFPLRFDEAIKLFALGSVDVDEVLSVDGINNRDSFWVGDNLAIQNISHSVRFRSIEGEGIHRRP